MLNKKVRMWVLQSKHKKPRFNQNKVLIFTTKEKMIKCLSKRDNLKVSLSNASYFMADDLEWNHTAVYAEVDQGQE